jgi:3-hydroxyisobutyrate dehydrogenase
MTKIDPTSVKIGFIGTGTIGKPMAANLLNNGFTLTTCVHHNRQPVEELQAQGAQVVANPKEVAENSTIIITCVPDAPEVSSVCLGEQGIIEGAAPGTIVIDCSTISPTSTQAIAARLKEHSIEMLDAPISGGPERAARGELAIMVGGEEATFARARPVLEVMGKSVTHVGPNGMGEVIKLANNTICGLLMIGISEAFTMAVKAGGDAEQMREVIMQSAGANFLLDQWVKDRMLKDSYDAGFATTLMQKDLGAALEAGRTLGVPMMMTALAYQLYEMAEGQGYGKQDYCSVSKLYQDAAHITIATGEERQPLPEA